MIYNPIKNTGIGTGLITIVHADGTSTVYNSASNTDVSRGVILLTALATVVNYDQVYLAPATFNIGNNIAFLNGSHVGIIGSGKYQTIIIGDANKVLSVSQDNSVVAHLQVQASGTAVAPEVEPFLYTYNVGGTGGHCIVYQIRTIGNSDSFTTSMNDGMVCDVYDTSVETQWDGFFFSGDPLNPGATIVVNLYNCRSTSNAGSSSAHIAHDLQATLCTVNVFGGFYTAKNGSTETTAIYAHNGGTINLYGPVITTSGSGPNLDLRQTDTGVINVTANTRYDTTKTSGTIGYTDENTIVTAIGSTTLPFVIPTSLDIETPMGQAFRVNDSVGVSWNDGGIGLPFSLNSVGTTLTLNGNDGTLDTTANTNIGTTANTQKLNVGGSIAIQPDVDWANNDFDTFNIGQDPGGFSSNLPLRFRWSNPNSGTDALIFDDGAGNIQTIRANINADSISSSGFFGGSYFGDASGLTSIPTNQFVNGNNFLFPKDSKIVFDDIPAPTNTITTGTSTTGGTLAAGTYYYWVSYVTSDGGETDLSAAPSAGQVTTGATSVINLSAIPKSTDSRVVARNIWRGFNNSSGILGARFLVKINNNTATTYTDNGSITVPNGRSIFRAPGLGNTTGGVVYNAAVNTKNVELDDNGILHFLTSRSGFSISAMTDGGDPNNRVAFFNTTDEVNNVQWASMYWDSNIFHIGTMVRNGGGANGIQLFSSDTNGTTVAVNLLRGGSPGWFSFVDPGTSQTNLSFIAFNPTGWSGNNGTNSILTLGNTHDISQSGTAAYNILLTNITETSTGSGAKRWINMQLGGVEKFTVANTIAMVQNLRADSAIGQIIKLNSGSASADFVEWQDSSSNILAKVDVNGRVATRVGLTTATTAKVGGVLFDHFADANNGTTVETDLYSDTLAASTMGTNGDKILSQYQVVCTGAALASQEMRIYFGGTSIYDTGALSIGAITSNFTFSVTIIRESSSVVRCSVEVSSDFATLFPYSKYTRVTGLTLTNTQILKITGQASGAGGASNQITAVEGYVEYKPAV